MINGLSYSDLIFVSAIGHIINIFGFYFVNDLPQFVEPLFFS